LVRGVGGEDARERPRRNVGQRPEYEAWLETIIERVEAERATPGRTKFDLSRIRIIPRQGVKEVP
jgi:hypothetical protein